MFARLKSYRERRLRKFCIVTASRVVTPGGFITDVANDIYCFVKKGAYISPGGYTVTEQRTGQADNPKRFTSKDAKRLKSSD